MSGPDVPALTALLHGAASLHAWTPDVAAKLLDATLDVCYNSRVFGFRIVLPAEHVELQRSGVYAGADIDHRDGFIHMSPLGEVAETAKLYFGGVDELVVLVVLLPALGDAVQWDHVPSRDCHFPHVYPVKGEAGKDGEPAKPVIPLSAVCHAYTVSRDPESKEWRLPALFTAPAPAGAADTGADAGAAPGAGAGAGAGVETAAAAGADTTTAASATAAPDRDEEAFDVDGDGIPRDVRVYRKQEYCE